MHAREDNLHCSISGNEGPWHDFLRFNRARFSIGLESFIPEKTLALGKYPNIERARSAPGRLEEIAKLLHSSRNELDLYWILFRPQGTMAEAKREIDSAVRFFRSFPGTAQIWPLGIFNNLQVMDGAEFNGHPAGVTEVPYALFWVWAQAMHTLRIMPRYQSGRWKWEDSIAWLTAARRYIDQLDRRTYLMDLKRGNIYQDVMTEGMRLPGLKIIDNRIFLADINGDRRAADAVG
ncbi:MAG: hypothetical protein JW782_01205 [Candidatus Saganbacteria bacterium]|nr:hypothetical protein [Candidatus Saganbacteria bacterium]